ncbi:MAG: hypothetical protein ISS79_08695 [Phycisphaerae bacterium]|nr:hypothetical protein [Phycisphaerae bacterium]
MGHDLNTEIDYITFSPVMQVKTAVACGVCQRPCGGYKSVDGRKKALVGYGS